MKGGGDLVDDFKGHRNDYVKTYVKSFKSNGCVYYSHELCSFLIIAGGITPKSQPMDGFIHEYYDNYMLNSDENEAGHTIPP